jgi:hypothetical protein
VIGYNKKGQKRKLELTTLTIRDLSKDLRKGKIRRVFILSISSSVLSKKYKASYLEESHEVEETIY